ncbi:hypothetical protein P153DRAFT_390654 [Dothidotthia symphoricarpi CBS 119687]|uniref:Uncharacterized protein n=1 Tax=Dothidotthia symphoricarpi CBS 119687 TaxID=1392245 RepID=A0A6A5ZYZ6_9PLEO|nr:uncharacterized protein P153DRAFT_390654 [Dothidotthia symphoricarpi CBS 119687]KAF2124103.1 hypothetical protein P153DRAFT_390654 [Dothidotthia symphoricarpi CBS 119687]
MSFHSPAFTAAPLSKWNGSTERYFRPASIFSYTPKTASESYSACATRTMPGSPKPSSYRSLAHRPIAYPPARCAMNITKSSAPTYHSHAHKLYVKGTKGLIIEHTVTTPVIDIAEDGQTAKGVWISPGHETFPTDEGERAMEDLASPCSDYLSNHFNQDWFDVAMNRPEHLPGEGEPMESIGAADRGVSFNEPYYPSRAPAYQPVPPDPYNTWEDTFSCMDLYEYPSMVNYDPTKPVGVEEAKDTTSSFRSGRMKVWVS